jgi:outer membrane immunogenic protein
MKKILLSSVALIGLTAGAMAADLPSRRIAPAPVIPAVPAFTWTGFYVGVQAGYTWGEDDNNITFLGVPFGGTSGDLDGFVGGAHAGFNYQFGSIVVGLEADIEGVATDNDGVIFTGPGNGLLAGETLTADGEVDFQGSLRARFGFAFDRALIYATGGFAFVNFSSDFTFNNGAGTVLTQSFEDTEWGWTLGAGIEYAITNNFTARVEYRYTQLDGIDNNGAFNTLGFASSSEPEFHTIRAGVSYKF